MNEENRMEAKNDAEKRERKETKKMPNHLQKGFLNMILRAYPEGMKNSIQKDALGIFP